MDWWSTRSETDRFVLEIAGRIDGVLEVGSRVVIEEIKTTRGALDARAAVEEPTHWGQLQVYAYIYALQNSLDRVEGRLTYVQLESGETREIERHFTLEALGTLFDELTWRYLHWVERIESWRARARTSSLSRRVSGHIHRAQALTKTLAGCLTPADRRHRLS